MTSEILSDLPVELLIDHLLLIIPLRDLLALGATNHYYTAVCNDELLWKMKCKMDFDFSDPKMAKVKGWKFVYNCLRNVKVFVWGGPSAVGKGVPSSIQKPRSRNDSVGIPDPVQVDFPKNCAIVDLVADESSFHALDSWGRVYVWGALDGRCYDRLTGKRLGYSFEGRISTRPLRLELPERIRAMSCGESRMLALDVKGQIWAFRSWGLPSRLVTAVLNCSSPESTPIQVTCGPLYDSVLTASGDVYIWWPLSEPMRGDVARKMNQIFTDENRVIFETPEGTIPCKTWDLRYNPLKLPNIPGLPHLPRSSGAQEHEKETKIIKIAATSAMLMGLTNRGHILMLGGVESPQDARLRQWQYLPNFSEADKIRELPALVRGWEAIDAAPPKEIRIVDVTAQKGQFAVFTDEKTSIILYGNLETAPDNKPGVQPKYLDKCITSIALGSYFEVALSSDGKLYTKGSYFIEEVGFGYWQPPCIHFPTEVLFESNPQKGWFCFATTAAGCQSGALLVECSPR